MGLEVVQVRIGKFHLEICLEGSYAIEIESDFSLGPTNGHDKYIEVQDPSQTAIITSFLGKTVTSTTWFDHGAKTLFDHNYQLRLKKQSLYFEAFAFNLGDTKIVF